MPMISSGGRTVHTIRYTSSNGGGGGQTTTTTTTYGGGGGGGHSGKYGSVTHDGGAGSGLRSAASKRATPRSKYVKSRRGEDVSAVEDSGSSPNKAVTAGRGGFSGTSQDFKKLQKELLSRQALYEDPEFPANDSSLFYQERMNFRCEWKRPHEILSNPEFITDGASRFDVRQGNLGDCWLLAAVASLSLHKELFDRVVPHDQNFTQNYCGMFRFRFWRFGEWQEILVDDRLPTHNGQLVFMHSTEKTEFWSALLEKAYAKLVGSYEALRGGTSSEACEDFTGGITETFDLTQSPPKNLFDIMTKAQQRSSLMGCSIDADPRQLEAHLPNGLIMGHAYSITNVMMVNIQVPGGKSGKIPLVRVRNPWGNEDEWKGAWGDKSREWQCISDAERSKMGLTFDDDGEFWMSFQDFSTNFQKLEICHLGPQSMDGSELAGTTKRRWEMCLENGEWKKRISAGGCRNYIDTFWTNPQFRVTVVDADDDDDDDKGTIIVGLMQKNRRKKRSEGLDMLTMGYAIYKLDNPNSSPLDMKFFKYNASIAKSPAFINMREICGRHKLTPGTYCIIPSTFEPNEEAEFLIRIFSEHPSESSELDEDTDLQEVDNLPPPTPQDDQQIEALRRAFSSIAGDDMEIDAMELKNILDAAFKKGGRGAGRSLFGDSISPEDFKFDGFSMETCRSMVAMMDVDLSGKLGFDEFKILWTDLRLWKTVFKKYDVDKSGNFNSYELRQTLQAVGFRVSNSVFSSLVLRYSSKQGVIGFDDFILICCRLKTVFETFKAQKKTSGGEAVFDKDTFFQCIMYS